MATETTLATAAGHDRRQAAISRAARHLYDVDSRGDSARGQTGWEHAWQASQSQGGVVRRK